MQKIWNALQTIWDFLNNFWEHITNFFKDIFISLWEILKDIFLWLFETLINFAITLLNANDFSSFTQYTQSFGALPAEILNVAGLLGLGTCMGIIITALLIRMTLQLIPFVRLGS